jgi:DNA (cytosine-5)-methyltransferase 1
MIGRWGTGGGNVPYVAFEDALPVLMRQREGKAGGGKGPLLSTDLSPSLVGSNELVLFAPTGETIYAFDTQFGSNAAVMENVSPTLKATQTSPSVGLPAPDDSRSVLAWEVGFGFNSSVREDVSPTLRAGQDGAHIAIPIDDVREIEKHQNGLGVADDGDPAYTLDTRSHPGVAYSVPEMTLPISHAALRGGGVALTPSPDGHGGESLRDPGFGLGKDGDPMYSLTTTPPAVATTQHKEQNMTDTPIPKLVVRRLTPIECERLMGWPDDHTLHRADGKTNSDSTRYKMCGNGVASPVAQWIATHILKAQEKLDEDRGDQ